MKPIRAKRTLLHQSALLSYLPRCALLWRCSAVLLCLVLLACTAPLTEAPEPAETQNQPVLTPEQIAQARYLELKSENENLRSENKALEAELKSLRSSLQSDRTHFNQKIQGLEDTLELVESNLQRKTDSTTTAPGSSTSITPITTETLNEPFDFFQPKKGQPTKDTQPAPVASAFNDPDLQESAKNRSLKASYGAKPIYDKAYKILGSGDYPAAIAAFEDFLKRYPRDQFSDNARYWVAFAHWKQRDFSQAEKSLRLVLTRYKHGETSRGYKTSDAIFLLGRVYRAQKNKEKSRYYFEQVIARFPQSVSAENAKKQLQTLNYD